MIRLGIQVESDWDEFLETEPVRRGIRNWARRGGIRGTRILQEEIRAKTGTYGGTGQLREDIGLQESDMGFVLVARAPHAGFVNDGTRPHEIRPRNKQALAFPMAGGLITRSSSGKVGTRFMFGGKTVRRDAVFAMVVRHPGTKATLFAESAAERIEATEPDHLDASIQDAIGRAG